MYLQTTRRLRQKLSEQFAQPVRERQVIEAQLNERGIGRGEEILADPQCSIGVDLLAAQRTYRYEEGAKSATECVRSKGVHLAGSH